MKKLNKFVSVLLTLVMAISMTTTAMAIETEEAADAGLLAAPSFTTSQGDYEIVIENVNPIHEYKAYQIFDAEIDGEELAHVQWGDGVSADSLLENLKNLTADESDWYTNAMAAEIAAAFADCETAFDVAVALKDLSDEMRGLFADVVYQNVIVGLGHASVYDEANGEYTIEGVAAGYYLIIDLSCDRPTAVISDLMLINVDGDDEPIKPKADSPTVIKTVEELDYDLGDTVTFDIVGAIPNMKGYHAYKYVFHDTMSEGLTLVENSITVTFMVDGDAIVLAPTTTVIIEGTKLNYQNYTISTNTEDGCTYEVAFEDLVEVLKYNPALAGADQIVVTCDAVLNDNAVIGNPGNPNEVYLEYSRNPNTTSDDTTTTPEDEVIVYSFEIDVNKIDDDGNKLAGASFVLQNAEGEYYFLNNGLVDWVAEQAAATELTSGTEDVLKFVGLDAGTYTLIETVVPVGYSKAEDTQIVIDPTYADDNNDGAYELVALLAGDADTGIVLADVVNTKDTVIIPETGGMGTTLFYVVGGMLTAGAAVMFVTRKRIGEAE